MHMTYRSRKMGGCMQRLLYYVSLFDVYFSFECFLLIQYMEA